MFTLELNTTWIGLEKTLSLNLHLYMDGKVANTACFGFLLETLFRQAPTY